MTLGFGFTKIQVLTSTSGVNPQLRVCAKGISMNCNVLSNQPTRRIIPAACAAALAMAFAVSLPSHAAGKVFPPTDVPENLKPDAGSHPFLVGHAFGTQNYVCAPSSNGGVAYVLFTPEATLVNDDLDQVISHFFSPNPDPSDPNDPTKNAAQVADGAIRATWQHSKDGSSVWAKLHTKDGVGAAFTPDKSAVAWLLLDKVGVLDGLTGGNILSKTTQVQRVHTTGGVAPGPGNGCDVSTDVGHTAFVDYTADYFFYTNQ